MIHAGDNVAMSPLGQPMVLALRQEFTDASTEELLTQRN